MAVISKVADAEKALVRLEGTTRECPSGGKSFKAVNAVSMDVADGGRGRKVRVKGRTPTRVSRGGDVDLVDIEPLLRVGPS